MAAYAALVSLRHVINHINHHPNPPISLDKKQVGSLIGNVIFLQDYLENYSFVGGSKDSDDLESRISDTAHAAEDLIESHVAHQIQSHGKNISPFDELYQSLRKAIQDLDSIKRDVRAEIEDKKTVVMQGTSSISACSLRSPKMVGFDYVFIEVMDKLTSRRPDLQIIPVVGMGGIGKTTLARSIYVNPTIVQHFDMRCWATISQDYCVRQMLLQVVLCIEGDKDILSIMSEHELGEKLHKSLFGRKYLIVMDDLWNIEAWDQMKKFLPNNNNGSRIMVTTRLSNLASQLSDSSHRIEMGFLDEDGSWNLLHGTVFGEDCNCPLELEEIGKRIAKSCKGLPLSIVVIGGFLAKSQKTREHWEYVAGDLHPIVNSEDGERCLKILHMSYHQLPVHLKPCFLHMGIFPEDHKIRVSSLIKLWVAEGFLKPISHKSMEAVARDYLEELISRNLVSVHKFGSVGNIKLCTMHDLLREMCSRVARKERFLNVINLSDISTDTGNNRRICFPQSTPRSSFETYFSGEPEIPNPEARALLSSSNIRSLMCDSPLLVSSLNSKLVRVFDAVDPLPLSYLDSLETILKLVNSRYLSIRVNWHEITAGYLSSLHLLWNLQTLIFEGPTVVAPSEIWNMSQLRHVKFRKLQLPDPPQDSDGIVLENLQTLSTVIHFNCSQEVVKRIPKIKKLKVIISSDLNNFRLLHRLESLCCAFYPREEQIRSDYSLQRLVFPSQLKKLTLLNSRLRWGEMGRIGSLRNLQVLKLKCRSFAGGEWETREGQFGNLRFLLIEECFDLESWTMKEDGGAHFPRLEKLVLRYLGKLKEVPLEIGEIHTLNSIELDYCSESAVASARKIVEEEEENGNVCLHLKVQVQPWEDNI